MSGLAVSRLQWPNECNMTWCSGLVFHPAPLSVSSHQAPPENFSKLGTSSSVPDLNVTGLLLQHHSPYPCQIVIIVEFVSATAAHDSTDHKTICPQPKWLGDERSSSRCSTNLLMSLMKSKNLRIFESLQFLHFRYYLGVASGDNYAPSWQTCFHCALIWPLFLWGGKI